MRFILRPVTWRNMRSMGVSHDWAFGGTRTTPKQVFGHKFDSRKPRRTKRDRVTRNGADSRFSVYVKSKRLQQSRGYILVILVTAYPFRRVSFAARLRRPAHARWDTPSAPANFHILLVRCSGAWRLSQTNSASK